MFDPTLCMRLHKLVLPCNAVVQAKPARLESENLIREVCGAAYSAIGLMPVWRTSR
jgi:hypothetical protein